MAHWSELATALSSRYGLKAADATHLATAVIMGADRFITNNQRDFPATITEVQVTYPGDLPSTSDADTSTVEGMLTELVRRGRAPVREIAEALRDMGYVPAIPDSESDGPRELYVGWSDPARVDARGKYTAVLEPGTVSFARKADRPILLGMTGAIPFERHVAFRLAVPDGVAHAKAAARKVKR